MTIHDHDHKHISNGCFCLVEQILGVDHVLWMFNTTNNISTILRRFVLLVGSSMSGVERCTR